MWKQVGVRAFTRGMAQTIERDLVFGGTYASGHFLYNKIVKKKSKKKRFLFSMLGACVGCVLSSPFNYARNMQYAVPLGKRPPSTFSSLKKLIEDAKSRKHPLQYIQARFRIGWGTVRVCLGMAIAHELYEAGKKFILRSEKDLI